MQVSQQDTNQLAASPLEPVDTPSTPEAKGGANEDIPAGRPRANSSVMVTVALEQPTAPTQSAVGNEQQNADRTRQRAHTPIRMAEDPSLETEYSRFMGVPLNLSALRYCQLARVIVM